MLASKSGVPGGFGDGAGARGGGNTPF